MKNQNDKFSVGDWVNLRAIAKRGNKAPGQIVSIEPDGTATIHWAFTTFEPAASDGWSLLQLVHVPSPNPEDKP